MRGNRGRGRGWTPGAGNPPSGRITARAPELAELESNPVYHALIAGRFKRGGRERDALLGVPAAVVADLSLTPFGAEDLIRAVWGAWTVRLRAARPFAFAGTSAGAILSLVASSPARKETVALLIIIFAAGFASGLLTRPESVALEVTFEESGRARLARSHAASRPLGRFFQELPGLLRIMFWGGVLIALGYAVILMTEGANGVYQSLPADLHPSRLWALLCLNSAASGFVLGYLRSRVVSVARQGMYSESVRLAGECMGEQGSRFRLASNPKTGL